MPYQRARRVLSNFLAPTMPGAFGGVMGVEQGFYSPEENWVNTPTSDAGVPSETQPSQPPEGAAPAGRTGVQQGSGPQQPLAPSVASSQSPSFGRVTLRTNPFASGVQQQGVRRPLSQARRYGL